jgi:hypothetical protein|tara:strand:- start:369 stop:638 length:270 start_codon:yes stop_codon:yes gene_type:complete
MKEMEPRWSIYEIEEGEVLVNDNFSHTKPRMFSSMEHATKWICSYYEAVTERERLIIRQGDSNKEGMTTQTYVKHPYDRDDDYWDKQGG